ncbi:MAG: hypothetical protein JJT75_01385 [Opitutales bacterium]|nr:hypothetical protein [Opitutales bacterium]MCH8541859.1 hypothetical protein [Opitutales bacterium]
MPNKIDFTRVEKVLRLNLDEEDTVNRILKQLREEEEEQEEKKPRVKRQFVIMISDPEEELPQKDLVGWVLQIPEEDSPTTAEERLIKASYDFNASPRGRKLPVMSVGEACENVTAKFLKEYNLVVKTKTPVHVQVTRNELPADEGGAEFVIEKE